MDSTRTPLENLTQLFQCWNGENADHVNLPGPKELLANPGKSDWLPGISVKAKRDGKSLWLDVCVGEKFIFLRYRMRKSQWKLVDIFGEISDDDIKVILPCLYRDGCISFASKQSLTSQEVSV